MNLAMIATAFQSQLTIRRALNKNAKKLKCGFKSHANVLVLGTPVLKMKLRMKIVNASLSRHTHPQHSHPVDPVTALMVVMPLAVGHLVLAQMDINMPKLQNLGISVAPEFYQKASANGQISVATFLWMLRTRILFLAETTLKRVAETVVT